MNRTIKDATVKRYHYASHDQLRQHLHLFIEAYNHAHRLKTLRGLTPYEYVARVWTEDPTRFKIDPYCHTSGLSMRGVPTLVLRRETELGRHTGMLTRTRLSLMLDAALEQGAATA